MSKFFVLITSLFPFMSVMFDATSKFKYSTLYSRAPVKGKETYAIDVLLRLWLERFRQTETTKVGVGGSASSVMLKDVS